MKTLKERFLRNIRWTEGWCPWIWKGHSDPYGRIKVQDGGWVSKYAHRIAYELFIGPVPEGKHVLHDCDNPSCVWPEHLKLGSPADNVQESYDKGRATQVGERNAYSKLNDAEVWAIKYGDESGIEAAERFNVSRATVSLIRSGQRWNHI